MTRCFATKNNRYHLPGLLKAVQPLEYKEALLSMRVYSQPQKIFVFNLVGFEEFFPRYIGI